MSRTELKYRLFVCDRSATQEQALTALRPAPGWVILTVASGEARRGPLLASTPVARMGDRMRAPEEAQGIERVQFTCPHCTHTITAPVSLEGVIQSCPKCQSRVKWHADRSGPAAESHRKEHPINLVCVVCTACACVSALLPFIWLIAIPLAMAAVVLGVQSIRTYQATFTTWAMTSVSAVVLIAGLVRAAEVNDELRRAGHPDPNPRAVATAGCPAAQRTI